LKGCPGRAATSTQQVTPRPETL